MAIALVVNGTTYQYPTSGQSPGWGTVATNWAQAVTQGMLQKAGGAFTLTAEVDFGATFGIRSRYLKIRNSAGTYDHAFRNTNATASVNYELPPDAGTLDQVLTTSGTGNLTWTSKNTFVNGAVPVTNLVSADFSVASTDSLFHPFINVPSPRVVTVSGNLVVVEATVQSGGSIVVNSGGQMRALA